ncbi:hypothetical protein NC651_025016 [Populus alba x Populus x berolinensis]|nr:hypothetical protein NC651_025016 [Populus alba x Populus x berolinensis]
MLMLMLIGWQSVKNSITFVSESLVL